MMPLRRGVVAVHDEHPRGAAMTGGRRVRGARIKQVLEQDVARVLYSHRPRLEHTEPSLPGREAGVVS